MKRQDVLGAPYKRNPPRSTKAGHTKDIALDNGCTSHVRVWRRGDDQFTETLEFNQNVPVRWGGGEM